MTKPENFKTVVFHMSRIRCTEDFHGRLRSLKHSAACSILVAIAVSAMLAFAILAWFNKFWTVDGRIHYRLKTLSCLGFIWVM